MAERGDCDGYGSATPGGLCIFGNGLSGACYGYWITERPCAELETVIAYKIDYWYTYVH